MIKGLSIDVVTPWSEHAGERLKRLERVNDVADSGLWEKRKKTCHGVTDVSENAVASRGRCCDRLAHVRLILPLDWPSVEFAWPLCFTGNSYTFLRGMAGFLSVRISEPAM